MYRRVLSRLLENIYLDIYRYSLALVLWLGPFTIYLRSKLIYSVVGYCTNKECDSYVDRTGIYWYDYERGRWYYRARSGESTGPTQRRGRAYPR